MNLNPSPSLKESIDKTFIQNGTVVFVSIDDEQTNKNTFL